MTLRWRLTILITLLVGVTTMMAWFVGARQVLRPFEQRVFDAFADQAVYVARQVESGADPTQLGQELGVELTLLDNPRDRRRVRALRQRARRLPPDETNGLETLTRGGYRMMFPPGPRDRILVRTELGWVRIHRDVDLQQPRRRLTIALPIGALIVVIVASLLAAVALRPLDTARDALRRFAAGELGHRLPEEGPRELAGVARSFNHMAGRIEGLLRAEKELLAGISHELRTPLARLRLEMELLRDAGVPESRVAAMEGDIAELDGLIAEVIELSRLQLGDRKLEVTEVDLAALATRVVAEHPGSQQISVVGRGVAKVDAGLVARALANLVQNVRRYVPVDGTAEIRVTDGVVVVADDGPGVPNEMIERVFDPFWRAETSRNKASGGLGLGLMIVRQVAELHGGIALARNGAGGGFEVELRLVASGD
jgi:signal transduction histidine kinase